MMIVNEIHSIHNIVFFVDLKKYSYKYNYFNYIFLNVLYVNVFVYRVCTIFISKWLMFDIVHYIFSTIFNICSYKYNWLLCSKADLGFSYIFLISFYTIIMFSSFLFSVNFLGDPFTHNLKENNRSIDLK